MSVSASERFKIRTRRLILLPVDDCHVATLVRHWGAAEVRRYLWNDQPVTMDMVNDIVTVSDHDFEQHGYGVWAAYLNDDNTLVGACGLRAMQGRPWVEVLFSIRPRFQQRGLATEAARAVLQTAFNRLGLERVVAKHDETNAASGAVLRRLGMTEFPSADTARPKCR